MICEVCFTDSWQPCPPSDGDAIPDPNTPGEFMSCGYCSMHKALWDAGRWIILANAAYPELLPPAWVVNHPMYKVFHRNDKNKTQSA